MKKILFLTLSAGAIILFGAACAHEEVVEPATRTTTTETHTVHTY